MLIFCVYLRRVLVCIVFLACCLVHTSGVYRFLKKPPFRIVLYKNVPDKVELDCSTTDPTSVAKLIYRGDPRQYDNSLISRNGSVFTFSNYQNLRPGTRHLYRCIATSTGRRSIRWMTLILIETLKLSITITPSTKVSKIVGEDFNIACNVVTTAETSTSNLTIEWQIKTGSNFVKVPDKNTSGDSSSLLLMFKGRVAMTTTDYRCVARIANPKVMVKTREATVEVRDRRAAMITYFPYKQDITLTPSGSQDFHCVATGIPTPTIRWFKDEKEVIRDACLWNCKRMRVNHGHATGRDSVSLCLRVLNLNAQEDAGKYTCKADNGVTSPDKRSVRAIFIEQPVLDKTITQQAAPSRDPHTITCSVTSGYPAPKITWTHQVAICPDGMQKCRPVRAWQALTPDSTYRQHPSPTTPTYTSNLTVPASAFAEFYRCQATSTVGSDFHEIFLRRYKKEKASVIVKTKVDIDAETTFTIKCFITLGNFTWWGKDGARLPPEHDRRFHTKVLPRQGGVGQEVILRIVNATVNDSGLYSCHARGPNKDAGPVMNGSRLVTVHAVFKAKIRQFNNVTAYSYHGNKTNVRMTCHVDAHPEAVISWSYNGRRLARPPEISSCSSSVRGYYLLSGSGGETLVICDANNTLHSGWYGCHATNFKGEDRTSAYIDILTPPRFTMEVPKTLELLPGETINRTCRATGNPIPVLEWRKITSNGSVVVDGSMRGSGEARLVFKVKKEDYGNYSCVATNSRGSIHQLLLIERPIATTREPDKLVTILGASIGGGMGLLLIGIVLVCCVLHIKHKNIIEEYKTLKYLHEGDPNYKIDPDRSLLDQSAELPYDKDWEFPVERLLLQEELGSGAFGRVMKAEAVGILSLSARDKTSEAYKRRSRIRRRLSSNRLYLDSQGFQYTRTTVAVKMLKENATESEYKDLASELKIMIHLGEHKNIINLLGACTRGKDLMLIMEYAKHGNLLNFLRTRRDIYNPTWIKTAYNNNKTEFTLADQIVDAYQIAKGMDFLTSKKCIHRDLAARNILVDEGFAMKIGDFGLARDIYKTDLYVKKGSGLLPIKWMAPEALFDREYTTKTDVWAFGIVLWEILTLGGKPYPGIPLEQLLDYIIAGKRMAQPRDCPTEIYAIMRDCWSHKPEHRPNFAELVRRLERILEKKMITETSEDDDAYISVFADEQPKDYLEPEDVFGSENSRLTQRYHPGADMTDDEIKESPLPPVPDDFLENQHLPYEDSPYYEPNDLSTPLAGYVTKHVYNYVDNHVTEESPYCEPDDQPTSRAGHVMSHVHGYVNDHVDNRFLPGHVIGAEKRTNSESSAGVESGIGLDEDQPREDYGKYVDLINDTDVTQHASRNLTSVTSRETVV